jgi:LacI family transcriptional regulator, gluconate utilization system Gnt-I transcriptional repressor
MANPKLHNGHLSITVNDVARLAGVSAMTVSRVINTPDKVPPATAAKVQEAISKSGYVPNRMAGGLRSSKSNLVAAIVPTLSGPIFLQTIEALDTALAGGGYQLMVGQSGYSEEREDALIVEIIGRRPDGIVLTGVLHTPQGRRRLAAAGIPVIETWDLSSTPVDIVIGFSHEAVGMSVSRFLHRKGRRKLALIGGDDVRSVRRWKAYEDASIALGLSPPVSQFVPAPAQLADGRRVLRELLARHPDTDGIFCSSDLLALGVLIEARELGLDVPSRLSVVGFGDLSFAADVEPALTTVHIDGTRIGKLAAECIIDRGQHDAHHGKTVDVGFSIVERASA